MLAEYERALDEWVRDGSKRAQELRDRLNIPADDHVNISQMLMKERENFLENLARKEKEFVDIQGTLRKELELEEAEAKESHIDEKEERREWREKRRRDLIDSLGYASCLARKEGS